ncbi:uncharacterized protein PHACADRAFT_251117 [Phanerochaete carnosa HHB-10118-sp]|uniref:Uncharacterized protein n=1 Tax=Phanerochaete carnosa (strain HHB-10118-sp) TaxID=650164 RepID=K5X3R6_PHACS|nr:uncharacterized protein PHACADRAFT_251117 [Phanerochaete carnosa HHB-10118-sp]EKM57452.1 hypothetical protein PHACADRAFT_251117 [Phanerochaete carnosa HHB-10118-sp]
MRCHEWLSRTLVSGSCAEASRLSSLQTFRVVMVNTGTVLRFNRCVVLSYRLSSRGQSAALNRAFSTFWSGAPSFRPVEKACPGCKFNRELPVAGDSISQNQIQTGSESFDSAPPLDSVIEGLRNGCVLHGELVCCREF